MDGKKEEIFSKRIRAGKKRTYFIDVRSTRNSDYYITITESKRKHPESKEFTKHKIFLYKEDFNKFLEGLTEAVDYVKNELLPEYDFEKFDGENKSETITKDNYDEDGESESNEEAYSTTTNENESEDDDFVFNFDEDESEEEDESESDKT